MTTIFPPSSGHYLMTTVPEGAEPFLLGRYVQEKHAAIVHVTASDQRLDHIRESVNFFYPDIEVLTFPAWDSMPYDRVSPNQIIISKRLETLSRLSLSPDTPRVIVTTVNAITQRVLARNLLESAAFAAQVGGEVDRESLTAFLVGNGYVHNSNAVEPGEFATRGSIMDIFAPGQERGYRLDFFGNQLESIRLYDPLTQISNDKISELLLIPASEILLNQETIARFRESYRDLFGSVTKRHDPLYEAVSEGRKYAGAEHWLPLFYDRLESLLDYVPDAAISLGHLVEEAYTERVSQIDDCFETRKSYTASHADDTPYNPLPQRMLYIARDEWDAALQNKSTLSFTPFLSPDMAGGTEAIFTEFKEGKNWSAESRQAQISVFALFSNLLREDIRHIIIACFSPGSRERIQHILKEHDIPHTNIEHWKEKGKLKSGVVGLIVLGIEKGFEADDFILISEQDLLGERIARKRSSKKASEAFLMEASNFMAGELIVHKEHGIGRFEGLETLSIGGQQHDCMKLIYDGGDRLFIPVENIDIITRYGGAERAALDKLGGVAWQRRKAELKKRIQISATELLNIAAQRNLKQAQAYVPENGLLDEFCARFPFSETDDQLRTIDDVLTDLASGRPMDRLVCGDVGFGKTEVALRAAFAVVSAAEHGQVAVIVPTTLLCRQHYKLFKERFDGLGIEIRQLSRLASPREVTQTKRMLNEGKVDIVIGTHALLAKDVQFKNLGLLIVDEEQHFGVKQKEQLKELKANVHVLTLSATPIPRSLQMSLSGLRELSLIATPPVDRLAVRTYVMPFDGVVIREAILREFYRGGRTFYVCPRVSDLDEVAKKISALVPEVKLIKAHGRMNPAELDEVMNAFYDGKYDVLISTTIVESGLDIPTANTLIIHRADMYGLAQLYQLRGRVGRSKIRAYAYFTLPPKRMPTQQALKRLEVMQSLDALGAGFTLASHDMDIRGFGNLLGDEQSGQIKEVGIELYQQMLEETIHSMKRAGEQEQQEEESFSPQISIGVSVLIPESYVADLSLRLSFYRRFASLHEKEDIESAAAEMADRFGTLPEEVENLFKVLKIKLICRKAGIEKVDAGPKGGVISLHNNTFSHPEKLLAYIATQQATIKLRADHKIVIMRDGWQDIECRIRDVTQALQEIEALTA